MHNVINNEPAWSWTWGSSRCQLTSGNITIRPPMKLCYNLWVLNDFVSAWWQSRISEECVVEFGTITWCRALMGRHKVAQPNQSVVTQSTLIYCGSCKWSFVMNLAQHYKITNKSKYDDPISCKAPCEIDALFIGASIIVFIFVAFSPCISYHVSNNLESSVHSIIPSLSFCSLLLYPCCDSELPLCLSKSLQSILSQISPKADKSYYLGSYPFSILFTFH